MIGQDLQALRVAVKLHPLVHVEDRAAGHRGGPQDGHQRDVALLLEPLQVPADTGHLQPGRHTAGHHKVLARAEEIPGQRRGDAADVLRVEHVHRAAQRPGAGGALVQVGPGAGGEHRAGVIQDPVSDDARSYRSAARPSPGPGPPSARTRAGTTDRGRGAPRSPSSGTARGAGTGDRAGPGGRG